MWAFRVSLAMLLSLSTVGAASALSSMPVTGGNPFPMVFFTIFIIVLVVGLYILAGCLSRRKVSKMREKGDFEGLVSALKNPFLAKHAARALGDSRDERAIEPLIAALADRSEDVRCAAARALGEIGDLRADGPLERALHDDYKEVRDCASYAIKRIHGPA